MAGAPAGLGELFKHSWNRGAIMRAVTCGAGPAGQGSPPRAPPTAGGSGVPAACTAACRRIHEGPASACRARRPGPRASGGRRGCGGAVPVAGAREGGTSSSREVCGALRTSPT